MYIKTESIIKFKFLKKITLKTHLNPAVLIIKKYMYTVVND